MKINKTIILLATLGVLFMILIGKIDIGVLSKDNLEKMHVNHIKYKRIGLLLVVLIKILGLFSFMIKI